MKKLGKYLLLFATLLLIGCSGSTDPEIIDPYEGKEFQYRFEIQPGHTASIGYFDEEEKQIWMEDASGEHESLPYPARLNGSASIFASPGTQWDEKRKVTIQVYLDGKLVEEATDSLPTGGPGLAIIYQFD